MNQYKGHPASREQSLGFNESMVLNALELARTVGNEGRTVVLVGHNRAAETIVRKVVGECPGYESGAGAAGTFDCVCVERIGSGWRAVREQTHSA